MYCCATWTEGVQPHQVRLAEVAEPELPAGEPPAQPAARRARKITIERAGIARRRRLVVGDLRIVPPGRGFSCGGCRLRRDAGSVIGGCRGSGRFRASRRKLSAV